MVHELFQTHLSQQKYVAESKIKGEWFIRKQNLIQLAQSMHANSTFSSRWELPKEKAKSANPTYVSFSWLWITTSTKRLTNKNGLSSLANHQVTITRSRCRLAWLMPSCYLPSTMGFSSMSRQNFPSTTALCHISDELIKIGWLVIYPNYRGSTCLANHQNYYN